MYNTEKWTLCKIMEWNEWNGENIYTSKVECPLIQLKRKARSVLSPRVTFLMSKMVHFDVYNTWFCVCSITFHTTPLHFTPLHSIPFYSIHYFTQCRKMASVVSCSKSMCDSVICRAVPLGRAHFNKVLLFLRYFNLVCFRFTCGTIFEER